MRLIDADALIKDLRKFDLPEDTIDACTLRAYITGRPTIDPVKHAQWIDYDAWYECSKCGKIAIPTRCHEWFYCPKCGAKMDEE